MQTEDNEVLIVTEEESGERLDKILAYRFENKYSRTYFQFLIEKQLVLLNGLPVKKRIKPEAGDEIEVEFIITPEIDLKSEPIPLDILYEDEHLLAINKPAGMVVHPAPGHWTGTFVNALLHHCQNLSNPDHSLRPGIVHRLDKETSGVLLAAKTTWMQQKLVELFSAREVYKEYLAICVGNPKDGEMDAPIGRHPVLRKQMVVIPTGRKAVTSFKSISHNEVLSIVKVVISTGRTHQIRVHLKHKGTVVLGDALYGLPQVNKQYEAHRQLLHAYIVRLTHPVTGEVLEIKAPIPEDMTRMMKKINPNWEKIIG